MDPRSILAFRCIVAFLREGLTRTVIYSDSYPHRLHDPLRLPADLGRPKRARSDLHRRRAGPDFGISLRNSAHHGIGADTRTAGTTAKSDGNTDNAEISTHEPAALRVGLLAEFVRGLYRGIGVFVISEFGKVSRFFRFGIGECEFFLGAYRAIPRQHTCGPEPKDDTNNDCRRTAFHRDTPTTDSSNPTSHCLSIARLYMSKSSLTLSSR